MKVLIIDDDPEILMIASLCLQKAGGFEVVRAEAAEEGLRMAETERPNVVLLDYMMPDLDGPTVLARLRSGPDTRDIPVIFLTAKTEPEEVNRLTALGATGVIGKPFDPFALASEIRKLIGS